MSSAVRGWPGQRTLLAKAWEGPLKMPSWRRAELRSEQGRAVPPSVPKGIAAQLERPDQATALGCDLDRVCRPGHRPTLLPPRPKSPCATRLASRIPSPPRILSGLTGERMPKPSSRPHPILPRNVTLAGRPEGLTSALPPSPLCSACCWALPWRNQGGTGPHWQQLCGWNCQQHPQDGYLLRVPSVIRQVLT